MKTGAEAYSRRVLSVYDVWVLTISTRWIWRCPAGKLISFYNRHISGNHLDVGVGTGYFLDKCRFPVLSPRVALLDLNPNSLSYTAGRIRRYQPATVAANVLAPLNWKTEPFDSIGLNFLLHCLPGNLASKAAVFEHLMPYLKPGGVIFGSTILGKGVARNPAAVALMKQYNATGIFSNQEDDREGLEAALATLFHRYEIEVKGCVALFSGHSKD